MNFLVPFFLLYHSSIDFTMGRTTDLENKVQVLEYKFEKLQLEAQKSVSILETRIKELEEKLKQKDEEQNDSLIKKIGNDLVQKKPGIKCIYCDKFLFSDYGLVRHIRSKHSSN